ncbi:MAG: hypothetical protein AEth_00926 [Candidatus Argoarchaeum ethanivorans]|uniref:S-layer protein C-terminal domain-containing protein n=1 Tax=Candidatus Argoarchaeum ethanivorans TaxID=2608793 RepID=A0A8B3S3J3_9EURY|nr:MAG: hypothetical protein AEth_00926 [Candidatus Argoarchaeum ethanivorans]
MIIINFLVNNSDVIILGIIASILTILLQTVVKVVSNLITYILTLRWSLRRLFSFVNKEDIYVISGSIDEETNKGIALLMGPDASAAANLYQTIEDIYSNSKVKHIYSTTNQSIYIDENIVSVGGPVHNVCTENLMKHLKSIVFFDENDALNYKGQIHSKSEEIDEDYGLIIRMINPFATTRKALIIAGCGSHGVLAASILFNKTKKFRDVQKDFKKKFGFFNNLLNKNFIAIVKCRMIGNDVSDITFIDTITIQ